MEVHKGYGFGHGNREQDKIRKEMPGPGAYHLTMDKYTNLAYTMGSRTQDLKLKNAIVHECSMQPVGPGDYQLPAAITAKGNYA